MAKTKKKKSRWLWILIPVVIAVLFAFYSLSKNNLPKSQQSSAKYLLYQDDAVAKVKSLPEVIDYLKRIPNGLVAVNGEEDSTYIVQVYEFKDNHTATFNWYTVDKTTGEVKKEF